MQYSFFAPKPIYSKQKPKNKTLGRYQKTAFIAYRRLMMIMSHLNVLILGTYASFLKMFHSFRDYAVAPLLHETTPIVDQTSTVVAYVKKEAKLTKISDLRGKRAVFPRYDGLAWHAVAKHLSESKCDSILTEFFSDICAPGIEKVKNVSANVVEKLTKNCNMDGSNVLDGEIEALRSLIEGKADVAFISLSSFKLYSSKLWS